MRAFIFVCFGAKTKLAFNTVSLKECEDACCEVVLQGVITLYQITINVSLSRSQDVTSPDPCKTLAVR